MIATVEEGLTWLDKALWVVDNAVIADLPEIDEHGIVIVGSSQSVPGAGRLAHEVLAEAMRQSPRGRYRRGLTPRLWLALQIVTAFGGTASIKAMHDFASGCIPRDRQWELQILTSHARTRMPTMLTVKQLYTMADTIHAALDPFSAADDAQRDHRMALLKAITRALNDATLVVAPTSSSYAVDESGVWAWLKGPRKPKDVPPSDTIDALTPGQRTDRRTKGTPDPEITADEIEESDQLFGPVDEDAEPDVEATTDDRGRDATVEAPAAVPATEDVQRRSCRDPFASWGAKTHKSGRITGYYGYSLHAFVRVPDLIADLPPLRIRGAKVTPADSLAGPLLVQEFVLTSATTDVVAVTLEMVRRVLAGGYQLTDLLGDRHYSYKTFDRWIRVLWGMGISPVMDLRKDNHGEFDYNGLIVIDGTPHCGLPEGIKRIDAPGLNATKEAEDAFAEKIDERAQYALQRTATAWANKGKSRWRCPALNGQVGCPRRPATSQTASEANLPIVEPPTTMTPWCTADTASIQAIKQMKYQQEHYWGSRRWRRSWNRRTYVEGCFGTLKNHRTGNIHRGFMQVSGQPLVTLAITAAVVAQNLRELESWHTRASVLNDPERWDALRKGEKERAKETIQRLVTYAAHPLHRISEHQFGFTMLRRAEQAALDATVLATRNAA